MFRDKLFLAKKGWSVLRRKKIRRTVEAVEDEYSRGWASFASTLDTAETVDEWQFTKGVQDRPRYVSVDGRLVYRSYNARDTYLTEIYRTIAQHFPQATSITEFGCGLGKNLLYLKQRMPQLDCYGYELCKPGVEIARRASEKFNIPVAYSQLDYLNSPEENYVFPPSDIAITVFSLEQLPMHCGVALQNMLNHVRYGTIHLEPVPENYPYTYRGILGRIDHRKIGYLRGFDRAVESLDLAECSKRVLSSAHNPLMFPSVYVLKKQAAGEQGHAA